ncbi:AAA family ATPase [Vibrio coralliilyticus]|uniref:AAA family ATPase n=1 Tax=Vibrio coralliilyticus TaxID=190893 RepID=UPI00148CA070|nr:AAA family ATPase [Vibrio coralliilyticus]NOI27600.1 ATP-binding protein [Vibrio coralliilyticus]NOI47280.1 ATP-binding protein [Vibrio coralliilyticus]
MNRPILYIFSGLPASGKSTLAQRLAQHTSSMYVRIDTVEQGLRDLCSFKVEGEGYRLSYRIIEDNLRLGISAIADSCNPIKLTRREWRDVATSVDARFVDIEIWCSDKEEHKHRVQTRPNTVKNLVLPNWEQVENRHYEAWPDDIIRIDTAGKSIEQAFTELLDKLEVWSSPA